MKRVLPELGRCICPGTVPGLLECDRKAIGDGPGAGNAQRLLSICNQQVLGNRPGLDAVTVESSMTRVFVSKVLGSPRPWFAIDALRTQLKFEAAGSAFYRHFNGHSRG